MKKTKTVFKVRGLGLNREIERKVNFEKLFEMICKSIDRNEVVKDTVSISKFDIKRGDNKDPFFLEPREILKKYSLPVVFDKRVINWNDK